MSLQVCFGASVMRSLSTASANPNIPVLLNQRVYHAVVRDARVHLLLQEKYFQNCILLTFNRLIDIIIKTYLDRHHCTLLVFVILCFMLRQPRFWPTHFSTNIAWPGNSFYMRFRVTLEVCLQKKNTESKGYEASKKCLTLVFASAAIFPQTMHVHTFPFLSIIDSPLDWCKNRLDSLSRWWELLW